MRVKTIWEVYTYDVWGNKIEGYEVNDVYRRGEVEITLQVVLNNPDTPHEFQSAYPSDWKLRDIFGVSCMIETSGDDLTIYVNRFSDGYPIGELRCISHESLSPIREAKVLA